MSLDPTKDSPTTGLQKVRFEGGIENTQFGADLLDADHRLKRIAIGFLPSGVPGLKSSWELEMEKLKDNTESQNQSRVSSRFWFYPVLPSVSVRQGVVAIKGLKVGVFTEILSAEIDGQPIKDISTFQNNLSDIFAKACSDRYTELARVHPSFSRVQGLDKLVALTRALEELDDRPDLAFWLQTYQIKPVETKRRLKVLRRQEAFEVLQKDMSGRRYKITHRRELSGGVQLMAIALRLNAGDVTALKEAVLTTRPKPDTLSWNFVVGEWIILTSEKKRFF